MRDGSNQYFIKWRDLPYQDCSWEDEDMEIPDLATFVQYYEDLRFVCGADGKRKKKKKKGDDDDSVKRRYNPPPDKPTTNLDDKYEEQPRAWLPEGLNLHPYQLEGESKCEKIAKAFPILSVESQFNLLQLILCGKITTLT